MRFLAAYLIPICILAFVIWQSWKVLSVTIRSNRRQRRIKVLQNMVCSTTCTPDERRAAMEEMLDESLRPR